MTTPTWPVRSGSRAVVFPSGVTLRPGYSQSKAHRSGDEEDIDLPKNHRFAAARLDFVSLVFEGIDEAGDAYVLKVDDRRPRVAGFSA